MRSHPFSKHLVVTVLCAISDLSKPALFRCPDGPQRLVNLPLASTSPKSHPIQHPPSSSPNLTRTAEPLAAESQPAARCPSQSVERRRGILVWIWSFKSPACPQASHSSSQSPPSALRPPQLWQSSILSRCVAQLCAVINNSRFL